MAWVFVVAVKTDGWNCLFCVFLNFIFNWRVTALQLKIKYIRIQKREIRGQQRLRWLDDVTDSMGVNLGDLQKMAIGGLACCGPWGRRELDIVWQLSNNNNCFTILCWFLSYISMNLP